jgi:hypothetical protein
MFSGGEIEVEGDLYPVQFVSCSIFSEIRLRVALLPHARS